MPTHRLVAHEERRDRFARTAKVTLNRFPLSTPYYFTLVKSQDESDLLMDLTDRFPGEHFGGAVVRLFDSHKIIGNRFKNRQQKRLDLPTRLAEESFLRYIDRHPIIVDPSTDDAYYLAEMRKWKNDSLIHPTIRDFAKLILDNRKRQNPDKWRKGHYWTLWNFELAKNPAKSNDLIVKTFDAELHYGSSTLLVPGPLIDDVTGLQTAIEFNETGEANAVGKDADFGNYFILTANAILDREVRESLSEFIAGSKVRLNFLKFKFLNLRNASMDMLEAYADFYSRLAEIREGRPDTVLGVFENDCQAFVSATVCFDFVSTSMTGYDRYPRGRAKEGYGGIFSARDLAHMKFAKYKEAYVNNGEKPLCEHVVCRNIDPRTVSKAAWYGTRRQDYVLCMEDLMTKVVNYVWDGNIEQTKQDVTNSYMSPLKNIIPSRWGDSSIPLPTP